MNRNTIGLIALTLCITGCEPYVETGEPVEPLKLKNREYLLAVALDTSGSFIDQMFGSDGRAYRFADKASDRLFRDRMGTDDRVLLAQLSANQQPLLWEGTPRSLRKKFGSSGKLRDFILQHSDPYGSRLYGGVTQVLNYIQSLPGVNEGETKVCILVLSDMMDNSATQAEDKAQMIAAMARIKEVKGNIGFYFVDIGCLEDTRQCLSAAG